MQNKHTLMEELSSLKSELKKCKVVMSGNKLQSNGIFGKLGSVYSSIYSPDLMLAVTLSGQLNLITLIDSMEKIEGVKILSANTDGILVSYPLRKRGDMNGVIKSSSTVTSFEYEETQYSTVAMKDVNNYIAIQTNGKVKTKGLYAELGLNKNPTMQVCSNMVVDYLKSGIPPKASIKKYTEMKDFVEIRNVKGGGVQHTHMVEVDDWVELPGGRAWVRQEWLDKGVERAPVKRVSRPKPVMVGRGGVPFGRVARWYMTTQELPPLSYVKSGNKVPSTDGARVCMTLPETLPDDLDYNWYITEAWRILADLGVT